MLSLHETQWVVSRADLVQVCALQWLRCIQVTELLQYLQGLHRVRKPPGITLAGGGGGLRITLHKDRVAGFLWWDGTTEIRVQCTSSMETFLNEASGSLWHRDLGVGIRPFPMEHSTQVTFADGQPEHTQCCMAFCAAGEKSLGPPS